MSSKDQNKKMSSSDTSDNEMDRVEYTKLLSKMFPSRFIKKRVKELQSMQEDESGASSSIEDEGSVEYYSRSKKRARQTLSKKEKQSVETETEVESSESDSSDESEAEAFKQARKLLGKMFSKNKGLNIMLRMDEEYDDDELEDEDEDEDSEYEDEDDDIPEYTEEDGNVLTKLSELAYELKKNHKKSQLLKEIIEIGDEKREQIKASEKKRKKKQVKKNYKHYSKIIKGEKKNSEASIFKGMSLEKQEELLKKLDSIKEYDNDDMPFRISLMNLNIPINYKSIALRKMSTLDSMEPGTNEYYKMKQWVDTFMQIPFDKYAKLPITIDDGIDKCHEFMEKSKKTLDDAVYGMNDVKIQIMQMIGQWITNPDAIGTAIAIKGPMGTGKTTIVKDGISKILGREFAFIALGGATDSSVLEGHSYTYEGSTWGKIVDILVQCKTMNPVIYFDELDKISDTARGAEIASILTHLTDTSQNSQFHDKYFSEIELDLSKCMFIFSYNEEEKVNRILRDRMYRISTRGYKLNEKKIIADKYLLPKILEQLKFKSDEVIITEDVMKHIIEKYTDNEEGVRNLKRCLETIFRKLNLFKLMKPGSNIFEADIKLKVKFPFTLTNEDIDKVITIDNSNKGHIASMYM